MIQEHKEVVNQFPLVVFHHLVQATRDILGPEATIVYEVVSKEMGADSTVAAHMVLQDVGAYGLWSVLSISRDWSRSEIKSCNPKNQLWDNPENGIYPNRAAESKVG